MQALWLRSDTVCTASIVQEQASTLFGKLRPGCCTTARAGLSFIRCAQLASPCSTRRAIPLCHWSAHPKPHAPRGCAAWAASLPSLGPCDAYSLVCYRWPLPTLVHASDAGSCACTAPRGLWRSAALPSWSPNVHPPLATANVSTGTQTGAPLGGCLRWPRSGFSIFPGWAASPGCDHTCSESWCSQRCPSQKVELSCPGRTWATRSAQHENGSCSPATAAQAHAQVPHAIN